MTQAVAVPTSLPPAELAELARRAVASWHAGRSPRTVRARELDLGDFARHLPLPEASQLPEASAVAVVTWIADAGPVVTRERVLAWRSQLEARQLSASTVARRLSTVQSLVRELGEYHLPWALRVRLPKVDPYGNAHGPSTASVESAIAELGEAAPHDAPAARDLAAVLLLYDVALRVSSVAGIRFGDLDADRPAVRVEVKGGRRVWRTLSRRALVAAQGWLEHRDAIAGQMLGGITDRALLRPPKQSIWWSFGGRGGAGPGLTADALARVTRRRGLGGPHGLRHAAATHIQHVTGDVRLAQALLGHRSVQTTQVYLDQIRDDAGRASRIVAREERAK